MTIHRRRPLESVWDYPRPPRLEHDDRLILVRQGDITVAESTRSIRVLETSHPPVFYLAPDDIEMGLLSTNGHHTLCEFKGRADYWDLAGETPIRRVAWSYPQPSPGFEPIAGMLAFYPSKVECLVDGERVQPQDSGFYGGWITAEIIGPFKGRPGTRAW